MRRFLLRTAVLAIGALIALPVTSAPAAADPPPWAGRWHKPSRHYAPYYAPYYRHRYRPPRVVYGPPVYYAPRPRVYYPPPPVYYAPPPVYYPAPSLGFSFNIPLR
ncbi:MAG: hypothetical protein IT557_07005 [Alphaproteobacteria bacterium]|nr:hypothetical protein [Alphaproteobacteria bacterium]